MASRPACAACNWATTSAAGSSAGRNGLPFAAACSHRKKCAGRAGNRQSRGSMNWSAPPRRTRGKLACFENMPEAGTRPLNAVSRAGKKASAACWPHCPRTSATLFLVDVVCRQRFNWGNTATSCAPGSGRVSARGIDTVGRSGKLTWIGFALGQNFSAFSLVCLVPFYGLNYFRWFLAFATCQQ